MYPTNYLGSMTLCKEIYLISQTKTNQWNHEESFPQEQVESGGITNARGSSTNPLIKSNQNDKSGKDFVKLKLRRDQTSAKSNPYEFEIDFFDNGELEDFLLFVRNFNMPLAM